MIAAIDIVGFILSFAAVAAVLAKWKMQLRIVDTALLIIALSLTMVVNLGNYLEWSGITGIFDIFEDYLHVLVAAFWGFFLVSLIQYQYEMAYQEIESKYQDLVQSANSIILRMSTTGHINFLNRYGLEFFGYTESEIIGRHVVGTIVPGTESSGRDLVKMIMDICLDAERFRLNENENVTKEGRRVWISWTNRPIFDPSGHLIEILCIGNDITQLKSAESFLKDSLEEKKLLLREIHHRVKNNLQVISGLLSLQSMYVRDPKLKDVFKESENRIISMSLIHQELYQSTELAKVDCETYIRNLTSNLYRSYNTHEGRVRLITDVEDVKLGLDTAVPCGLIINELVTNALIHAFPDKKSGEIVVEFRILEDGRYKLSVRDDGTGLPDGLDYMENRSLGLQLVVVLAKQMNANLEVKGEGGTSFTLVFEEYTEAGTILF